MVTRHGSMVAQGDLSLLPWAMTSLSPYEQLRRAVSRQHSKRWDDEAIRADEFRDCKRFMAQVLQVERDAMYEADLFAWRWRSELLQRKGEERRRMSAEDNYAWSARMHERFRALSARQREEERTEKKERIRQHVEREMDREERRVQRQWELQSWANQWR